MRKTGFAGVSSKSHHSTEKISSHFSFDSDLMKSIFNGERQLLKKRRLHRWHKCKFDCDQLMKGFNESQRIDERRASLFRHLSRHNTKVIRLDNQIITSLVISHFFLSKFVSHCAWIKSLSYFFCDIPNLSMSCGWNASCCWLFET
jgi:hypothetical protein